MSTVQELNPVKKKGGKGGKAEMTFIKSGGRPKGN